MSVCRPGFGVVPQLRRDEVALLAGMSTDYFTRLEQARGPHPSTQIVASLARALRLTDNERDHLYFLAGHPPPPRAGGDKHVGPGLLHLLTKLDDTPASVMSDLGETLVQNAMHVVLFGDSSTWQGLDRYIAWRWFTGAYSTMTFLPEDRDRMSRKQIADLRAASAPRSSDAEVTHLVTALRANSPEFEALWREHIVEVESRTEKRFIHPEVGLVEIDCEVLATQKQQQNLLVYFPLPGTDAREKLELLRVIGTQTLR